MVFNYEAFTRDGKKIFGTIEAERKDDVAGFLYDQEMIVSKISAVMMKSTIAVKPEETIIFTRLLATAINASLPLTRALEITMDELPQRSGLRSIILSVLHQIKVGKSLSSAISLYPKVYSPFFINMIKAGEKSGKLGQALSEILKYLQKRNEMKKKMSGALMYPVMMLSFAVIVLGFFVTVIIPKFQESYAQFGKDIPELTLAIINITKAIRENFIWIVLVGGAIAAVIVFLLRSDRGRRFFEQIIFAIPIIGALYLKDIVARFTRTVGVLLTNGVTLVESLELVIGIVNNKTFEWTIHDSIQDLTQGKSFTNSLKNNKYVPAILIQMASMGEESGRLAELMSNLSDFYEREVEVGIDRITTIISPIMIIFIGLIIGVIVIALFLPIFNMSQMLN